VRPVKIYCLTGCRNGHDQFCSAIKGFPFFPLSAVDVADVQYREIATKCWEVGQDIRTRAAKNNIDSCEEAIEWFRRGLNLVQILQKRVNPVAWLRDLNIAIRRSLGEQPATTKSSHIVRSHLAIGKSNSESLGKAKALFFDLTKLVDSRVSPDIVKTTLSV
jgi:hypothetical protein